MASSWPTLSRTVTSLSLVISSETFCRRVGGKAHVAVGEDADELAGAAVAAALDHRNAGNVVLLHQRQRVGERRVRLDGDRVHHHAGFELLHLAHLRGLLSGSRLRWMTPMPPACAMAIAMLASVTVSMAEATIGILSDDVARDARADIDVRRQDIGQAGLQQHVVEGVSFARNVP